MTITGQDVSGLGTGNSYLSFLGPSFYLVSTDPTTDLSDIVRDVIKFEYHEDEKNQDQLLLTLNNSGLKYTDDARFTAGLQLQVRWGYPGDFSDIRTAIIVRAAPDFPQSGIPTMELASFDLRRNMNRGSKAKNWGPVSSSFVAYAYASKYNWKTDIEESNDQRAQHRVQCAGETDLQYLMFIASKLNWDCYLDGSVLHFHHKRYEQAPTLEFTYYTDALGTLLSFKPEVNLNKPPAVGVSGADTATQAPTAKSGANSTQLASYDIDTEQNNEFNASVTGISYSPNPLYNPSRETDPKVIKLHSDAAKQRVDMQAVKAAARFIGTPRLRARSIVKLSGLGQVYSGNWRVSSVKHVILPQGDVYTCHVELSRNALSQGTAAATNPNNKDTQQPNSQDNEITITTQQSTGSGIIFNAGIEG